MNEGKRKIGEYTVLCSVNVGEKEVILASNEQSTNGDKFMCGFAERNDLFELCSECIFQTEIQDLGLYGLIAPDLPTTGNSVGYLLGKPRFTNFSTSGEDKETVR